MKEFITEKEIKEAIHKNKITHWFPFKCSICNQPYGYYFYDDFMTFDSSCDCCSINGEQLSSYSKIVELYEMNKNNNFGKSFNLTYQNVLLVFK